MNPLITLPNITDTLASTTANTTPVFTMLFTPALFVLGIVVGGIVVGYLVRGMHKGITHVTGTGPRFHKPYGKTLYNGRGEPMGYRFKK